MKRSIAIIVLLAVALGCSRNPVTGKKELSLMSEQQEIALGKSNDPSIVAQFGLYQDEAMQKFIDTKGQQMAKVSHRPDLKYEFKVLDSPVVNAFAVPGGFVYFTRGIMAHFNNEAEFAGVLGHEIGHITAKHSVKQYTNAMFAQIGLIAGIIIKPELAQYMDVASTGLQLLFLKFGRDDESQSDQLGVEYSTEIGYQAHEMADFFQTLNRLSGGPEGRVPAFLSTHPDPVDRYNTVHRLADDYQAKSGVDKSKLKVNRESYLQMIDGLIYGEDPRQGYVENNNFYHPEMKFVYPIPGGWKTVNSPLMVQMAPEDGKAVMILKLSKEKSLTSASNAATQELDFTVYDSYDRNINGFNGLITFGDKNKDPNTPAEQQTDISIHSGYIDYSGLIFEFHGLSETADIDYFSTYFNSTITGFKKLTDNSKIDVYPNKIVIRTINENTTLKDYLMKQRVPSTRYEEHAVINGMTLGDLVNKGDMIKIISGEKKW